jgi:hypothetical protein
MTDSPPPLPIAKQSCCGRFPAFLAGLLVGAAVVGVAATVFIKKERERGEAVLADARATLAQFGASVPQAGQIMNNLMGGQLPVSSRGGAQAALTDAGKIKALGDESVDDLRQGRLLAVYRLTTKEYQAGKKREDFEKMMADVKSLGFIYANPLQRESKVRKAADGDGYEYYCSSEVVGAAAGNVVFSFIFVPGDNNSWRISDVQVNHTTR